MDIKQIILTKKYEDGGTSIFVSGQGRCAMLTVPSSLHSYETVQQFIFFLQNHVMNIGKIPLCDNMLYFMHWYV
jgi:hypothetical protein